MTGQTLILATGAFGDAVAQPLAQALTGTEVAALDASDPKLPDGAAPDFVLITAWRRYAEAIEILDERLWAAGTAWSTVVLEGPILRSGPVVIPGVSPCHCCFTTRQLSNSEDSDRELARDACLARDHALGEHGFTPALVEIARALALDDQRAGAKAAGRVRYFDIRTGTLTEEHVVRVHGCRRCCPTQPAGARYWQKLRPVIKSVGGD